MKTIFASEITDSDSPFVESRGNADGTVTLYYEGDEIPPLPEPPPAPPAAGPLLRAMLPQRVTPEELSAIASSEDARVRAWMLRLSLLPADTDLRTLPGVCDELQHMIDIGLLDETHRAALLA